MITQHAKDGSGRNRSPCACPVPWCVPPNFFLPAPVSGKQCKPTTYYAKNFKLLSDPEREAFLDLRLHVEKFMITPRFDSYWQG